MVKKKAAHFVQFHEPPQGGGQVVGGSVAWDDGDEQSREA